MAYYIAMYPFNVLWSLFKMVIDLSIPLLSIAWDLYKTIEDAFSPILIPIRIVTISIAVISILLAILCPKKKQK